MEYDWFIEEVQERLSKSDVMMPGKLVRCFRSPIFFDSEEHKSEQVVEDQTFCRFNTIQFPIWREKGHVIFGSLDYGLQYPPGTEETNYKNHDPLGAITLQEPSFRKIYGYPEFSASFDLKKRALEEVYVSTISRFQSITKLIRLPNISENARYRKEIPIEQALDVIFSSVFQNDQLPRVA